MPRVPAKADRPLSHLRPPFLWEEFTVGTVPPAQGLDGRGETIVAVQSGDIQKRYVLWARAERLPMGQVMLATGLSRATIQRVITTARRNSGYFRHCQFVMPIRWGKAGKTFRYLCRYCGWAYHQEIDANQCGWNHVFAPRPLDKPSGRLFRRIDVRVPTAR